MSKLKNLLCGASTIMNFYPNTQNDPRMRFLDLSDAEALYSDWFKVGEDLREVMNQYKQEQDLTNKD